MQIDTMQERQSEATIASAILLALRDTPLALKDLKGRVPKPFKKLRAAAWNAVLDELADERRIYRHYKPGKDGRPSTTVAFYSLDAPPPSPPPPPPPEERARDEIVKALSTSTPSAAELKKHVRSQVAGLAAALYESVIEELVAAKKIHARRSLGKNGKPKARPERYTLEIPPPTEFLTPVLDAWKLAKIEALGQGIDERALTAALISALELPAGSAPSPFEREAVLRGLRELVDREGSGSLIAMRKLRALVRLPKDSFDAVLLDLYATDAIILHHHDHVAGLSPEEREALVDDKYGNHYVGVALRGGS